MTKQIFKKNQKMQFIHGHQTIMCLNGDKFEHHRVGNNLGIEKNTYKDKTLKNKQKRTYLKPRCPHMQRPHMDKAD